MKPSDPAAAHARFTEVLVRAVAKVDAEIENERRRTVARKRDEDDEEE